MAATSFLTMTEAKLPPGFRFHPRDEELINEYLAKKLSGEFLSCPMMEDVDLNKVEPWELPGTACVGGKEWYFYSLRDKKYATGQRTNRATLSGYWKATGKDRHISDARRGGILVGMRKTLVFYQGRAPKGKKTHWVMHEFRMEPAPAVDDHRHQQQHLLLHHHPHPPHLHLPKPAPHAPASATTVVPASCSSSSTSYSIKEDWVLCRVFYKSRGLSPKQLQGNIMRGLDNCTYMAVDDTGSSSLPPLMDTTYINFQQQSQNHQTNTANINNSAVPVQIAHAGGYNINEPQVPCFSNLRYHNTHLPPLMENANNNVSAPAASTSTSTSQIGRTATTRLPDMTSFLGPLVNYGCEN